MASRPRLRRGGAALPLPSVHVPRPHLDEVFEVGVCRAWIVLGVAGWGKTTTVASWASRHRTVWLSHRGRYDAKWIVKALGQAVGADAPVPATEVQADVGEADRVGATAAALCDWLRTTLATRLVLVVDDLQWLPPGSEAVRLVEGLCWHAPDLVDLVLVSRRELPFSLARLRGQGLVAQVDTSMLALDPAEIEVLLHEAVGVDAVALAKPVWERTAGWPAAVRAALELLSQVGAGERADALDRLVHPGGWFHTYLTEEVIGREPPRVQDFLRRTGVFGEVTVPATSGLDSADLAAVLADLTRRGLLRHTSGEVPSWTLSPPLARYFQHDAVLPRPERAGLHAAAAGEFMARGAYDDALRHLVAAGDREGALGTDHGAAPGTTGAGHQPAEPEAQHLGDLRLEQIVRAARQVRGNWSAAFEAYQSAAADSEQLPPELGWRIIWLLQMQGELAKILPFFGHVAVGREDTLDEAWLLAEVASTLRLLGDLGGAAKFAGRALAAARRCGRPSAYLPTHTVLAMLAAAEGDRRQMDAHFTSAADIAEKENDLIQLVWVRVCRAVHILEMGSPREAAAESDQLRDLAEKCGVPFVQAHACTVFAQASLRLGSLDTAAAEFATAIELFRSLGSRFLAWPLSGLGDVYRTRGQLERARAAYEEALRTAAEGADRIGESHALIGLARVRAADDLADARRLAQRAMDLSEPLDEVAALLTRGWIALLGGDRRGAAMDAVRAGAAARWRRDDLGLAEAITLTVLASENQAADAALLTEAIQIWQETGCRLREAATRIVAGTISGSVAGSLYRLDADPPARTMRASGVDIESRRDAGPLAVLIRSAPTVSIRALGLFQVIRDGVPVPTGEWQSKKARDLLKILVARRRPTPRDLLLELLWPATDPGKSAKRLSVLLSMARDILQADRPEAGPLMSDGPAVWLDHSLVHVDVEEFLERAQVALDAFRSGESDAAEQLTAALAAHTGDFLEDDPYEDWAAPLAEEIRAKYMAVLRALISTLRASGDVDRVIEYGLKLLEQDAYDEETRLDLVAALLDAGRLGEARRHYDIYARRMREIDVEPRPMPRLASRAPTP
jgi:ATP/maltotriose-dependent transcriptional regulator MalT/DNA-binding SARP family transcriptional activator